MLGPPLRRAAVDLGRRAESGDWPRRERPDARADGTAVPAARERRPPPDAVCRSRRAAIRDGECVARPERGSAGDPAAVVDPGGGSGDEPPPATPQPPALSPNR